MCYDINEYNPFDYHNFDHGPDEWAYSEPMDEYNWEEWLDFGDGPYMV